MLLRTYDSQVEPLPSRACVIALCFALATVADGNGIKCGVIALCRNFNTCCYAADSISISSTNVTFAKRDVAVNELYFANNEKIFYLPVLVYKKFPNLLRLNAINCSVREVRRENFERLNKLFAVNLSKNFIETIADDTFEHLSKLQEIDLCKLEQKRTYDSGNLRKLEKSDAADGKINKFEVI